MMGASHNFFRILKKSQNSDRIENLLIGVLLYRLFCYHSYVFHLLLMGMQFNEIYQYALIKSEISFATTFANNVFPFGVKCK